MLCRVRLPQGVTLLSSCAPLVAPHVTQGLAMAPWPAPSSSRRISQTLLTGAAHAVQAEAAQGP